MEREEPFCQLEVLTRSPPAASKNQRRNVKKPEKTIQKPRETRKSYLPTDTNGRTAAKCRKLFTTL
jgi:hypothetical protein